MTFKKNQIIRYNGQTSVCLVADKEYAVFGKYIRKKDGGVKIKFTNPSVFVLNNTGCVKYNFKRILPNFQN